MFHPTTTRCFKRLAAWEKMDVLRFTMVELLVTIAVIAILTAILFPALGNAKNAAKQTICVSNLKQWAQAFASYSASNNDYLPSLNSVGYGANGEWYTNQLVNDGDLPEPQWGVKLMGNASKGIWRCPFVNDGNLLTAPWDAGGGGYGVAIVFASTRYIFGSGKNQRVFTFLRPSQTWLMGDCGTDKVWSYFYCPLCVSWPGAAPLTATMRHPGQGGINCFIDGHCAGYKYTQLLSNPPDDMFVHYSY